MSISPQGYIYGKDPKSQNPFWDEGSGPGPSVKEYIKSINGTVVEDEDGVSYKIKATNQDGIIENIIDILVPKITDYITSTEVLKVETENETSYYVKYYTKDGEEHGAGIITVPKPSGSDVEVTGEEVDGVNTITITVDGVPSSFDVPTRYVKDVAISQGEIEDNVYTFTDESGHTTEISSPGQYLQSAGVAVSVDHADLNIRGIVGGSAASQTIGQIRLENNSGTHRITVSNSAGDSISDEWTEGSGGGLNFIELNLDEESSVRYTGNISSVFTFTRGTLYKIYVYFLKATGSSSINMTVALEFMYYHRQSSSITYQNGSSDIVLIPDTGTLPSSRTYDAHCMIGRAWGVNGGAVKFYYDHTTGYSQIINNKIYIAILPMAEGITL